jgi:hypothetical protein
MTVSIRRATILTSALLLMVTGSVSPAYAAAAATTSGTATGVTPGATTTAATPAITGTAPGNTGAFNVILTPVSQELEAKQGAPVTTTIQIQNQGIVTEHLRALIYTFGAHGEDGTPQLIKPTANDDFINWASLSTTQFDAEPNVWASVKLTINPPKTAAFGYYYAVIFTRANQPAAISKQANLLGAAASLVLVNVQAPGAKRALDIAEFSTAHKTMEFLPANFTVRMHNTGNTHVAPRGNIFIKKGNQNIALLEVNLEKGQILPNSYRLFDETWADGTPVYKQKRVDSKTVMDKKTGKPVTTLDWNNFNLSKLRFGHYTARLVMVYNNGSGDIADTAALSFWVIPWRIIGVGLLALIVALAGLWSIAIRPLRNRMKRGRGPAAER